MLLDDLRNEVRVWHYSRRTEEAYAGWIEGFIVFSGKRHPRELNSTDVQAFLTHLAVARHVNASTNPRYGAY